MGWILIDNNDTIEGGAEASHWWEHDLNDKIDIQLALPCRRPIQHPIEDLFNLHHVDPATPKKLNSKFFLNQDNSFQVQNVSHTQKGNT